MQIDPQMLYGSTPGVSPSSREAEGQEGLSYADVIAQCYPVEEYRSRDEINDEDMQLQAFKEDLTSKGALRFFIEFNLEKIEKMVEEYRAKLEAYAEENPDAEMDIESMVTAFRKQLMEQLMNEDEEKAGLVNPNRAAAELLPEATKPLRGTLESLLHGDESDDTNTVLI